MPRDEMIHEAVRAHASYRPHAPAVVHDKRIVTYHELNRWSDDLAAVLDAAGRPPPIVAEDGNAAMVFFTSGSTGEPKAVLSPHRATSRLFHACTFGRFDPTAVMIQASAVPWEAFALELWGPLVTGGTRVLITARPRSERLHAGRARHDDRRRSRTR